jgi:predicted acyl esterase
VRWFPFSSLLTPRGEAPRTATHDDPAVQRALTAIGEPLNPVQILTPEQIAEVYRQHGYDLGSRVADVIAFRAPTVQPSGQFDPHIYLNAEAERIRNARTKPSPLNDLLLQGTLVHEQTHNTETGPGGELAAMQLERDYLTDKLPTLRGLARRQAEARVKQIGDVIAAQRGALARSSR